MARDRPISQPSEIDVVFNSRPAAGTRAQRLAAQEAPVLLPALLVAGVVLMVLGATGPLWMLFSRVSPDYGEGWNAYWAAAALRSPAALYSPSHILVSNNYPPLSFYVNGLVGRAIGDELIAGRLVALASLLSVAGIAGWIVLRLSRSATWAAVSALLVLLYAIYPFGQFFALNNPQWLGQAVMLLALIPLIGSERPGVRGCILSAACVVAGLLVKQNQFALPLAIAAWLFLRDRRLFALWCAAAAGFAIAAGIALYTLYGTAFYAELLGFKRTYALRYLLKDLPKLACLIPFAVVGIVAVRRRPPDARWLLIAIYAGLGLAAAALQHFGAGVGENASYDALVGGGILTGALLGAAATGRIEDFLGPGRRAAVLAAALIPIVATPGMLADSLGDLRDGNAAAAEWAAMISDVRQANGPVLCEVLAVCFWAGKPMALDFFAYGQKIRTGTDPAPLRDLIAGKAAARIVLDRHFEGHGGETRLPRPLPQLMQETYGPVRSIGTDIEELAPR